MREWMIPAGIILLFAVVMAAGLYNDWQFDHRCSIAGGITTTYNAACVKPGSILFTSH